MATMHNPNKLMVKDNQELADLYAQTIMGIENGYTFEDIRKEIAYRRIVDEWMDEQPNINDDGGCGHDQNENYYRD